MALLDDLLGGGSNGGILGGIFGGSNESSRFDASSTRSETEFQSNPSLSLNVSDVLRSDNFRMDGDDGDVRFSSSRVIGDLNLDAEAPTFFSNSNWESMFSGSQSESDSNGGLLGGLI